MENKKNSMQLPIPTIEFYNVYMYLISPTYLETNICGLAYDLDHGRHAVSTKLSA